MTPQAPRIAESLQHLAVDIDSLTHDPANARKHDKRNIQSIKASLARFGQVKPVVLSENGSTVIAGNGTLQAARDLGWSQIAAAKTSLDGPDAVAYAIADNRTTDLSDFDDIVLAQLLEELDPELVDAAGFDAKEIEKLTGIDVDASEDVDGMDFKFRVVVDCESEEHQSDVVSLLEEQGLKCQKLIS